MKRLIFFLVIILSSLEVSHGIFGKKKNRSPKRPSDYSWEGENGQNSVLLQSSISRELDVLEQRLNGDTENPYPMEPHFPYGPGKCPREQWGCPCATKEESESGETGCWGSKKKGKNKKGKDKKKKDKKKKDKKKKDKKKKEKKKKCKSSFWRRTTPDPNESIYDNV